MTRSLRAAHEINTLWVECVDHSQVDLATCPSDETVAEIIDRHCPPTETPQQN